MFIPFCIKAESDQNDFYEADTFRIFLSPYFVEKSPTFEFLKVR
jgi:hypothetical protein